ncbi:MAG: xanthine phosphoribosyltransferase [Christensenellales bacterium]
MKLLEDKIKSEGRVAKNGYLSLSGFLNHGIDPAFLSKLGAEIKRKFDGDAVTKILTAEAAGIPLACFTAEKFKTNAVFARKNKREALSGDCWSAKIASYTAGTVYDLVVSKDCISSDDTVLIVDDFLAGGKETAGLIEIVRQSGAKLAGVAVAVEKTFNPGGALLRSKGIKLVSLTKISRLSRDIIEFEK